jgi:hypothetical protein
MYDVLLLVRKANSRSNLVEEAGVAEYVVAPTDNGKVLEIRPVTWDEKEGVSHYGIVLANVPKEKYDKLFEFAENNIGVFVFDIDESVEKTLAFVGLKASN